MSSLISSSKLLQGGISAYFGYSSGRTVQLDAAEGVGRRLAAFYGGDASVADRARVSRLPGFVHQKGKPFTSKLIHVDDASFPPDGSFDDYELNAFAFLPKLPKRKPSSSNGLGTLNPKAAKLLFEHYPVELLNGNEAWQNFAMALHSACGGNAEVAELFSFLHDRRQLRRGG